MEIGSAFNRHLDYFGMNYRVFFVPVPLSEPMGKVESGLMTLSMHTPLTVERYSFPGNYAWPMKLFMLDRCFLVNRYPVSNNKELLVINTHNSAYDDGTLRAGQMEFLRKYLLEEYNRGNYVIVGGDWNQTPHGFDPVLPSYRFDTLNLTYVEKDYPEAGWTWAFDPGLPTNRRVGVPYNRSTSLTTVIDYYLLSPNIELKDVETKDVDFKYSDHQPVELRAKLIPGI
jgi:endonuclease/exonuclease/phosphatase family metal-dependent hydrolase